MKRIRLFEEFDFSAAAPSDYRYTMAQVRMFNIGQRAELIRYLEKLQSELTPDYLNLDPELFERWIESTFRLHIPGTYGEDEGFTQLFRRHKKQATWNPRYLNLCLAIIETELVFKLRHALEEAKKEGGEPFNLENDGLLSYTSKFGTRKFDLGKMCVAAVVEIKDRKVHHKVRPGRPSVIKRKEYNEKEEKLVVLQAFYNGLTFYNASRPPAPGAYNGHIMCPINIAQAYIDKGKKVG